MHTSQMSKALGSTSIKYRFDTFVSDRYLIDIEKCHQVAIASVIMHLLLFGFEANIVLVVISNSVTPLGP